MVTGATSGIGLVTAQVLAQQDVQADLAPRLSTGKSDWANLALCLRIVAPFENLPLDFALTNLLYCSGHGETVANQGCYLSALSHGTDGLSTDIKVLALA